MKYHPYQWKFVLKHLTAVVSPTHISMWIRPLKILPIGSGKLLIVAPDERSVSKVRKHFLDHLKTYSLALLERKVVGVVSFDVVRANLLDNLSSNKCPQLLKSKSDNLEAPKGKRGRP